MLLVSLLVLCELFQKVLLLAPPTGQIPEATVLLDLDQVEHRMNVESAQEIKEDIAKEQDPKVDGDIDYAI